MFMAHVVIKGHRDGCTGSGTPPVAMVETENCAVARVMMIWVTCTETSDWSVPWTHVTARSHNWILGSTTTYLALRYVHDSHCSQRPQEPPTSGPPPMSMLESEGHVTSGTMPTSVACICTCDRGIVLPEVLLKVMSGTVAHGLTIVRVCIDVRGSGYYQMQCRCPSLDPCIAKMAYPPHRRSGPAFGKAGSTPHLRGLVPAGQTYQLGCHPGTHPESGVGIPQHLPNL